MYVILPPGALRAQDGTTINIKYKGVDVASPEALSALPDLTQIETTEGGRYTLDWAPVFIRKDKPRSVTSDVQARFKSIQFVIL